MTDIMKLADDYASACADVREFLGANAGWDESDGTWIASKQSRAALQSAIEALQAERAEHKENAMRNARIAVSIRAERDQLQSKLGDAIQSSAHWQHQFTEAQAENERLKQEREKDAFRLVWSMNWMRMSVHDHGFTKHVLERGGIGDYSDCATYIDKCAGATQEAAHGIGGTP